MVDMLLTGFDAPVEQVLYLDRPLREHGLLQAIARVNRTFSHDKDGTPTEKTHGLVVDYCGISHDLEQALASFEWDDVQDTMQALEEDPATVIDAAAIRAESHFRGLDLNDTWACVLMFAPDASTQGNYKADLFERFNADYRQFSQLMDRLLPDPRGLPYVDRLARLTLTRSLRPCPLPSRKRRCQLDRYRSQGQAAHRPAHQRRGPPDDAAGLHPRSGL